MGRLELRVLGEVTVSRAGEVVACPSAKSMELLGLLITRRTRPVARDVLARLLWPDEPLETTRRYLRQALWRLNSTLTTASAGAAGPAVFIPDSRPGWLWIDVRAFASVDLVELEEAHAAVADRPGADLSEIQVARLEAVAAGYGGEFMPGRHAEWCEPERLRAQEMHLSVREALIGYQEGHGRHTLALEHGRVVLEAEPARETTHRLLMRLHHRRGDRAAALRQYTRCAAALEEEYGVGPSAPTVLLHRRIQADDVRAVPERTAVAAADVAIAELNQRLNEIQAVLETLARALLPADLPGPVRPRGEPASGVGAVTGDGAVTGEEAVTGDGAVTGEEAVTGAQLSALRTGLAVLDARIRSRVTHARVAAGDAPEPMAGYYVSDAEVDRLLEERPDPWDDDPGWAGGLAGWAAADSRVAGLARGFGLTGCDVAVVLTCLGPEIHSRYGRLYAYLHDDLTRRAPSVDLVLGLWCANLGERIAFSARLSPGAPLRRHGLVRVDEEHTASFLESGLRLDPRITWHLLGDDDPDERLGELVEPALTAVHDVAATAVRDRAGQLVRLVEQAGGSLVVHLAGPAGSGRREVAAEFARLLGRPLLVVRGVRLAAETPDRAVQLVRVVAREARLSGAVTFWSDADAFATGPPERAAPLLDALADVPGPLLLGGRDDWAGPRPGHRPFVAVRIDRPAAPDRERLWADLLDRPLSDSRTLSDVRGSADPLDPPDPLDPADPADPADPPDPQALAAAFRFTPGRIREAVAAAGAVARARDPERPRLQMADLTAAARQSSGRGLAQVARHVVTGHRWDDLVLPPAQQEQLRALADQVRHRGLVHDTWEFGRSVAPTGGMTVLFAGPSGTGKTMAASVLANDLGVDLYAVDLATTVSKYLGETEQNLARMFEAAADGNAILFFDEADALFGRRTQVRDAHDRYANLETSYLLQQLEVHPGLVVLATNLRKNLDEAFVRRFRATITFPTPGEAERLLIWERLWPAAAPRSADVDLAQLAARVDLPGGHLRNIALEAAFLAAADGGVITMEHLRRATRTEYEKLGSIM